MFIAVFGEQTDPKNPIKSGEDYMQLSTPAFKDGGLIPAKFTCDATDVSPRLNFINVPIEARSLALICDDPDAPMGTWADMQHSRFSF